MMTSAEIRTAFLNYFNEQGHEIVDSSSLVPDNDPSLLFTNAGMVQFKDVFLGSDKRAYSRATTSQRCVRAGGKHNDLENVGYTARHHTFFEMLGNFSFGDYFKRDAIKFAWNFLTQRLGLPEEKLWVTVYQDDDEAADIWLKEMGVSAARFSRLGEKDNFWAMGDTGPCGPCSEIFYDHGPSVAGGPPGSPDDDGDRYIEIWNLVFMQFNRAEDGSMTPLPKPSVDTGMGLERVAAVMQNVHNNYDIDLFSKLVEAAASLTQTQDHANKSLRVIADHIRSCSFLIADGVQPSNEGRGYVLRRIIRRAVRHGNKLGAKEPFFHKLVAALVAEMGSAYPELSVKQSQIEDSLLREELQFAKTIDNGMTILEQCIEALQTTVIPGETVFKLYDTYGFPVDLTADIARERDLELDIAGFDAEMDKQKARSKERSGFTSSAASNVVFEGRSEFTGYEQVAQQANVVAMYRNGEAVTQLNAGDEAIIILDESPFYAESGGQVGDTGTLHFEGGVFNVENTVKVSGVPGLVGCMVSGSLTSPQQVQANVDVQRRQQIMANHSATHLLHAALRQILGEHVAQKGSLVEADKLRFDFSHNQAVSTEQLLQIEALVNEKIRANFAVETEVTSHEAAIEKGAMALFGEKYGDQVRVLSMGRFSVELCGGTHVNATGDIGLFKIASESGIAAGIRRIEAVTGAVALNVIMQHQQILTRLAAQFKTDIDSVDSKIQQLVTKNKQLEKEVGQLQQKIALGGGDDLSAKAIDMGDFKLLIARIDGVDVKSLRNSVDQLKDKLKSAVVVLATENQGKAQIVVGVTKNLTTQYKAGDIVNLAAIEVDGRGGGRPDMATAGGSNPHNLEKALNAVSAFFNQGN